MAIAFCAEFFNRANLFRAEFDDCSGEDSLSGSVEGGEADTVALSGGELRLSGLRGCAGDVRGLLCARFGDVVVRVGVFDGGVGCEASVDEFRFSEGSVAVHREEGGASDGGVLERPPPVVEVLCVTVDDAESRGVEFGSNDSKKSETLKFGSFTL